MPIPQTCFGGVRVLDHPCPINVRRLDRGALPMIEAYHRHGILLDTDHLQTLTNVLLSEEERIQSKIKQSIGREINWNSGDQVSHLLFKELGLKSPVKVQFTESGREKADEEALSAIKDQHEVVGFILEGKGVSKVRTTYAEKLPRMVNPSTGRLHTTFKYTRAETGRLTSEDPNLQNIPTRTLLGNEVRNGFVAGKDQAGRQCVLASIDLSQIEMVLAGDLSQDALMCGAFRDGVDIHTLTALKAFNLPPDAVNLSNFKHDYRLPAKCFHPDTEVLTRQGWKRIPDLKPGEEVVQATPEQGGKVDLSWVKPLEVFTKRHPSGRLIHLHNKGMDLRVTPDHRMLGWTTAGAPRVVEAEKFAQTSLRHWAGAGMLQGGKRKVDPNLLRLAVATQADGSVTVDGGIKFGFHKSRKTERLKVLLEAAGIKASANPRKDWMIYPTDSFYIRKLDAKPILALLDKDKTMPWSWVSLDTDLRTLIVDEVQYWDSCSVDTRSVYSTTEKKNADVLQALCAVTGKKTRLMQTANKEHKPMHVLSVRRGHLTRTGNLQSDELEHTDEVACISVPSTFILVRDKGVTIICGQTIGFGILYGQTGIGAQSNILANGGPFWSVAQCDDLIAKWFQVYSGIAAWTEDQYSRARRFGMVWDMWGRLRRIPEARSRIGRISRGGLRKAGNMPIQCLHPNTHVLTQDNGPVALGTLPDGPVTLWDGGQWSRGRVCSSSMKPEVEVTLMNGHRLLCSPEHRILLRTPKCERWATAQELLDQFAAKPPTVTRNIRVALNDSTASWGARKPVWDEVMLGRLASDGDVAYNKPKRRYYLAWRVAEHEYDDVMPVLMESITRVFGPIRSMQVAQKTEANQKIWTIKVHSKQHAGVAAGWGVKGRVPDRVKASSESLRLYLRGLFDGDGGVGPDTVHLTFGGGDRYLEWAREVALCLEALGIRSRLRSFPKWRCVRVTVMKSDCPLFSKLVGFINRKKQAKLDQIVASANGQAAYGRAVGIRSVRLTGAVVRMVDILDTARERFWAESTIVHNSSAQGMLKVAMAELMPVVAYYQSFPDIRCWPLLQIHDELIFELSPNIADEFCEWAVMVMTQGVRLSVPVRASSATAYRWGDLKG